MRPGTGTPPPSVESSDDDRAVSKDISITALATDKEIDQLWEIVGKILDRSNTKFISVHDNGELSVRLLADIDEDFKVTTKQVSQWVGNGFDGSREDGLLEIITDVANKKYDVEELNSDIRSYEW